MREQKVNYSDDLAISAGKKSKERDYWLNQLSGELVRSSFPLDLPNRPQARTVVNYEKLRISGDLFSSIMKLSKGSDYTLYVILLSNLVLLIHRYTGIKDIIVGAPIFKQKMTGDFLNTVLALRNCINCDMTFKGVLLQARQTLQEAVEHQNYPIEVLVYHLELQESGNGFPLFDIAVLLENIHDRNYLKDIRLNMVFSIFRSDEHIEITLEYDAHVYKKATMERIGRHFANLLSSALTNIELPLHSIEILSEQEKKRLLMDFNDTRVDFPRDRTAADFILDQGVKNPERTALRFEGQDVSYKQLNENAGRLAAALREKGVRRDQPVGILLDRSPLMVESILAVWHAGGAYIPISPDYPAERIRFILEDSRTGILLTDTGIAGKYPFGMLEGLQTNRSEIYKTAIRPQISDLDALPIPDRSLVNYEKYNRTIGQAAVKNSMSLQATRGCPYHCAYCHKIWPKSHMVRSAENLFNEVRLLYNIGVRRFAIVDDIFNLNTMNSKRFFQLIIENGLEVQLFFPNGLRGDLLTKEYIDLMIRAGTVSFALALETASPRLQKLIRKNLNLARLSENIQYVCRTYPHVILELFTMHGFPTETEEEALMTLEFIKRHKWIHFPYIEILHIFSGTDMEKLALENGISKEAILRSESLAFHELPDTLPFDKTFTLQYRADYFNRYFLSKDRLLQVLPHQMKLMTEDEMVQKYNSYLPVDIKCFNDFLEFAGISGEELGMDTGANRFLEEERIVVPNLNEKLGEIFPGEEPDDAFRVLLLDLSQYFSSESDILYDVVEPPLGLMYLMAYLKHRFGGKINGKIAKSRNEFDSYAELKTLLEEFKPDVIGIRTLNFFKDFFRRTAAVIRQWGISVPIIAGGPYATCSYEEILQDPNIDLAVLGEGEVTLCELIKVIMENGGHLPAEETLKKIPGIAFSPGKEKAGPTTVSELILVDEKHKGLTAAPPIDTGPACRPTDLAYIIFTSGSTGKPKGAMVEHIGMMNHIDMKINVLDITGKSSIAQNASHTFDISIWQFFAALMRGGKTVIYPNDTVLDPDRFIDRITEDKATILEVVPSYLSVMLDLLEPDFRPFDSLEYLLVTGEEVKPGQVERWFALYPGIKMVNAYGPTEASDDITHFIMDKPPGLERIPIGKPVQNFNIYIVDENMNLCPVGVKGEICVSGIGVGRGYMNNPGLTAERFCLRRPGALFIKTAPGPHKNFLLNHMQSCNHATMPLTPLHSHLSATHLSPLIIYKTGDLGRWLPDGAIEFFGRKDYQVKIRGHRIELEEIEKKIVDYAGVKEAVVIAGEENSSLYAFVTAEGKLEPPALKEHLVEYLPAYMIPEYIMQLAQMPLTSNGKIDRRALRKIKIETDDQAYAAPQDKMQEKIVDIWSDVLGVEKEKIGINTNFFELGGHSLKVTSLVSKIHKEFNIKVPFIEVFRDPTVIGLARYIKEEGIEDKYKSIEPVEEREYYTLSSPQARFYLLQQLNRENTAYNMSQILNLDPSFREEGLQEIFNRLIRRHESLRTSFKLIDNEPRQIIHPEVDFKIDYIRAPGENSAKFVEDYIKPFDLSTPPLFRAALINTGNEKILVVDMHHIISDGISLQVLTKEFISLYEGRQFAPLPIQYRDYATWQNDLIGRGIYKKMEKYWLDALGNFKLTRLPEDRIVHDDRMRGDLETAIIKKDTYFKIEEFCNQYTLTKFSFMFSIFAFILAKETGQNDISVGTPIANREHPDLENVIGVFLNVILLRAVIDREDTVINNILKSNKNVIEALENSTYPYEELYYRVKNRYNLTNDELFTILFNYIPWEENETIPGSSSETGAASPLPFEIIPKYNLTVYLADTNGKIYVNIVYRSNLYGRERIKRMMNNYFKLIETVLANENITAAALPYEDGKTGDSPEDIAGDFDTEDLW